MTVSQTLHALLLTRCQVLGIDISPQMLPTDDLPDNVIFELDDLNHE